VAPAERCPGYISTVRSVVASAEASGLVVILDLHWSDEGNPLSTVVGQKCMSDQGSLTFWASVATTFGADPRVMFELYNEPHDVPWSVWRDGGVFTCTDGVTFRAAGMQQMVDAVRGTGAQNVTIAGGNGWAYDLSGVARVGALTGGNVAYATHPYEGSAGDSVVAWDAAFGTVAAHAPVIATEFGTTACGVDAYDTDILTYFRAHGIAYTMWAWFVGGCAFPSVISDPAGTCAVGGCTTRADIAAYAGGAQPTVPAFTPFPPQRTPSNDLRFDFEDGSGQGWAVDYGLGMTAAATTAEAYSGTHSLALAVPASSYCGVAFKGRLTGLTPGMDVTYRVWVPTGAAISVEPYAADDAWTYRYLWTTPLGAGWNTIVFTIPPSWSAINGIGLQVDNGGGWTGSVALDAVAWGWLSPRQVVLAPDPV
jgi:hypothetical protein